MKTLFAAAAILSLVSTTAVAADPAQCQFEAREWASQFGQIHLRLKVPLWSGICWLAFGPTAATWCGILAANSESPRERFHIRDYEAWCMAGKVGDPPRVRSFLWEVF